MREIERVVKRNQKRLNIDHAQEPSEAKYPIYANPNVAALERNLCVWDMKQAGVGNVEIHETLFGQITNKQILDNYEKRDEGLLRHEINRLRQQRYHSVVARAFKTANAMIENTALGKFPCKDEI